MEIGDSPIFQFVIKNRAGDLADPTTIDAWVENPDTTVTHLVPVKISTGVYEVGFDITESGDHVVRCEVTGNVKAAKEKRFNVVPQEVVYP